MRLTVSIAAAVLILAGCADNTATVTNATENNVSLDIEDVPVNEDPGAMNGEALAEAPPTDGWIGKWTGPEGLALDVAKTETPGRYMINVTLLDGTESYEGTAKGEVIGFTRNGVEETIRAVSGDDTGLKYLAGKADCLMIKQAEGFCRG